MNSILALQCNHNRHSKCNSFEGIEIETSQKVAIKIICFIISVLRYTELENHCTLLCKSSFVRLVALFSFLPASFYSFSFSCCIYFFLSPSRSWFFVIFFLLNSVLILTNITNRFVTFSIHVIFRSFDLICIFVLRAYSSLVRAPKIHAFTTNDSHQSIRYFFCASRFGLA